MTARRPMSVPAAAIPRLGADRIRGDSLQEAPLDETGYLNECTDLSRTDFGGILLLTPMGERSVASNRPTGLRASNCAFYLGGGDGSRTHCLYIANVALYQLSYTPGCVGQTSRRRIAPDDGAGSRSDRCAAQGGEVEVEVEVEVVVVVVVIEVEVVVEVGAGDVEVVVGVSGWVVVVVGGVGVGVPGGIEKLHMAAAQSVGVVAITT
jgi:hypothetical protein